MTGPTSRHHDIDIWNPIVHVRYMGASVDEVVALLKADGLDVDLFDDSPPNPTASFRERAHIVTLQVRYDYVPIRAKAGRVIRIGNGAYGPIP